MGMANWVTLGVIAVLFGAVAWLRHEAVYFLGGLALAASLIMGGAATGWSPW